MEAADLLRRRALANDFEKLIVVAPPTALGHMRKHYHKEVQSRLVGEIAKDLANHPVPEIEKIIAPACHDRPQKRGGSPTSRPFSRPRVKGCIGPSVYRAILCAIIQAGPNPSPRARCVKSDARRAL